MNPLGPTPRRGFLARLAGAAAALTAGGAFPGGTLAAQGSAHDRWLTGLKEPIAACSTFRDTTPDFP